MHRGRERWGEGEPGNKKGRLVDTYEKEEDSAKNGRGAGRKGMEESEDNTV